MQTHSTHNPIYTNGKTNDAPKEEETEGEGQQESQGNGCDNDPKPKGKWSRRLKDAITTRTLPRLKSPGDNQ